ncbi:hypothetical protein BSNK01_02400 [Bacillaceae bacterium]
MVKRWITQEAFALMRKSLIATLGMERAKGFLLRYGQQAGVTDGECAGNTERFTLRQRWENVFGCEGIDFFKWEDTEDTFTVEGGWEGSVEAALHLDHYGPSQEGVCWFLTGYLSGFFTGYLGKRVIIKEISCAGKGDANCRFIGKTLAQWGKGIQKELAYYEEENVAFELDRAYRMIEQQKKEMRKLQHIYDHLPRLFAEEGDLTAIAAVLGQTTQCTVAVDDQAFRLLHAYGSYKPHDFGSFMQEKRRDGVLAAAMHELLAEKRTIQLTVSGRFGWKHVRLITPVYFGNETFAYLSLIKESGEFAEFDMIALEWMAMACAKFFLQERIHMEKNWRLHGELLAECLHEEFFAPSVKQKLKWFRKRLDGSYYLFVFQIMLDDKNFSPHKVAVLLEKRSGIERLLQQHLLPFREKIIITGKIDRVIALIPADILEQSRLTPKKMGEALLARLQREAPGEAIIVGISSLCKKDSALRRGYEEACRAIEIARLRGGEQKLLAWEDLGAWVVLLHDKNAAELKEFALRLLHDLLAYDQEQKAELVKTLYYFLENRGNIHETARQLTLSVGATRYRLRRIQEITNVDLTQAQDFFDVQFALQILLFFGLIDV